MKRTGDTKSPQQGDRSLWNSVIAQAIADATIQLPDHQGVFREQMEIIRGQARRWIKLQTDDFKTVCELAGLEASRVHAFGMTQIHEAIARDLERTANFLKGSMPGVVANFQHEGGDRPTPTVQKTEEIEFSQNRDLAPCQ